MVLKNATIAEVAYEMHGQKPIETLITRLSDWEVAKTAEAVREKNTTMSVGLDYVPVDGDIALFKF
jgi:ribosome-binding ATPase YchF (GTP1/OBG family)